MSRYLLVLSVGLYAACLPLDPFSVQGHPSGWPSWSILLIGWLPLAAANLAWLANPLLLTAWYSIFTQGGKQAKSLSLLSLIAAGSFLLMRTVVNNEGGIPVPITGYNSGYWLWLTSIGVALLAAFVTKPATTVQAA